MLSIKQRGDDGTLSEIATYEQGSFRGDPRVMEAFQIFEGEPEDRILKSLDGPNLVAVRQSQSESGDKSSALEETPFTDIPVLPDDLETLTEPWLNRWAQWIAAGRPEIPDEAKLIQPRIFDELEFNPALHPRDPDTGQFVERTFSVPSDAPNFGDMSTKETLGYIDENGGGISDTVLNPDSSVTVDGVPNDATSLDDIGDEGDEGDEGGEGNEGDEGDEGDSPESTDTPDEPDEPDASDTSDDGGDDGPSQNTSTVDGFDPEALTSGLTDYEDRRTDYGFDFINSDIGGPVTGGAEERATENLQAMLDNARDEEVASKMANNIGYIADEVDRAFAAPTFEGSGVIQDIGDDDASVVALSEEGNVGTINHEFGHVLGHTFGFDGQDSEAAHKGNYFPDIDNNLDRLQYSVGRAKGNIPNDLDEMMSRVRDDVDSGADGSPEDVLEAMEQVQDIDDPDARVEEYVKAANRAFNRQHVAFDKGGVVEAADFIIKDKYSTTNAHEVLSRTNEILQSGRDTNIDKLGVRVLANGHPDLLGSYMALFEPSEPVQEFLADEMGVEV